MTAYYNENDPKAAAWLRELIRQGCIAPGEVDDRSILDVEPADLAGFRQCHFFAGIGGWSYALRLAGWPDDEPVWTGSPPCQPFSVAGRRDGERDERHLAPHFAALVGACRPPVLFGEQVASSGVFGKVAGAAKRAAARAIGFPAWAWWDDLSLRLEASRYAVGAGDIPAASVGAPHIRQRCFFGAVRLDHAPSARHVAERGGAEGEARDNARLRGPERGRGSVGLADACAPGPSWRKPQDLCGEGRRREGRATAERSAPPVERLGHAGSERRDGLDPLLWAEEGGRDAAALSETSWAGTFSGRPGPADCFWANPDWLRCRDGKWRPVEPGSFPLASRLPARVGRLRGYGNAICPQAASAFVTEFVGAALDVDFREPKT